MTRYSLFPVLGIAALLGACGSTEPVSAGQGQIAVLADDMDALSEATEVAKESCGSMNARLDRTEATDDGVVAYYDCQ